MQVPAAAFAPGATREPMDDRHPHHPLSRKTSYVHFTSTLENSGVGYAQPKTVLSGPFLPFRILPDKELWGPLRLGHDLLHYPFHAYGLRALDKGNVARFEELLEFPARLIGRGKPKCLNARLRRVHGKFHPLPYCDEDVGGARGFAAGGAVGGFGEFPELEHVAENGNPALRRKFA